MPRADIDIPDVDVVGVDIADAAVVISVDLVRTAQHIVRVGVAGSVRAEVQPADAPIIAAVVESVPVTIDGRPDKVVAIAQRGDMGGRPVAVIAPNVSVGGVIVPIAIVACGVGEGIVSDPDVSVTRDIVPASVPVRHVIVHIGRTPIVIVVDVNPFAVGIQIRRANGRGLRASGNDWVAFGPQRQQPGSLAIPSVEVVLDISVEGERRRGGEARIDVAAFALGDHDGLGAAGVYYRAAPPDGDGGRALREHVYTHLRIDIDADRGHGRFELDGTGAADHALNIE
jgi:hypothetical protein